LHFINRVIYALTNLHPLHPMFVHFPIGLTGAAFFFILLAWWRKSALLEQVAFANISLAAVATVVAGATGIFDNYRNYAGQAPNAVAKMVLAGLLLLLTSTLALVRWRNPDLFEGGCAGGVVPPALRTPGTKPGGWKKALYILGYGLSFALAFVLAFLGGIILYGF